MKVPMKPLAERLRPHRLEDIAGQQHLTGVNGVFSKLLKGSLPSMILWGPPGVGKTTLAFILAQYAQLPIYTFSKHII